jgi:hypothetical protein
LDIAEDAAFAPARQLEDGKRAGSVHMRMSVVEVDPVYVADAREARDWSLFGGDAAEGVVVVVVVVVVVDAACHAVKSATKGAISVEAVAKAHAGTVALDRWAWVASLAACCV